MILLELTNLCLEDVLAECPTWYDDLDVDEIVVRVDLDLASPTLVPLDSLHAHHSLRSGLKNS